MYSPMIQYLRNMIYPLCLFYAPQDQVIILCSIKIIPESTYLFYNQSFYNKQMANIIIGS